jgi:hypothetical protein
MQGKKAAKTGLQKARQNAGKKPAKMFTQKARQNEALTKTVHLTETVGSAAGGVEFAVANLKTSATVGTSPFGRTRSGRRPTCPRTWSFFYFRQVLNSNGRQTETEKQIESWIDGRTDRQTDLMMDGRETDRQID